MDSIRSQYQNKGVAAYYQTEGSAYRNPHEEAVRACFRASCGLWGLDLTNVLDLACGSGEITLEVQALGGRATGIDPYTGQAYLTRTGQTALPLTFEDIALRGLGDKRFSLVVCSYAMHLVDPSWMPVLVHQLAQVTSNLLILTPHKRPDLTQYGWDLKGLQTISRTHAKIFQPRTYSLP